MFEEICTFYKALKPHLNEAQNEEVENALAICQDLDDDTLEAVRTLVIATAAVSEEQINKAIATSNPKWPSFSR